MIRPRLLLPAVVLTLVTAPAAAQYNDYTWTGAGVGVYPFYNGTSWSNPYNWQGSATAVSNTNTSIAFAASPTAVSINDIGSPFVLYALSFNVGITLSGSPLSLQATSATMISQNGAAPVTVANDLNLSNGFYGFFLNGSGTGSLTLAGKISGSAGLEAASNSTTILSNSGNSYSGGTNILSGTLAVGADGAMGAAAGGLSFGGGTLEATTSFSSARAVTVNSSGGTVSVDSGVTLALTGPLSGAGGITKAGPGTLTFSGNSSIGSLTDTAGPVTVGGGTLTLTAAGTPLSVGSSSALTISGGATVAATGPDSVVTIDGAAGPSVVVRGTGSKLSTASSLSLGAVYSGHLTVQNGGSTIVSGRLDVGGAGGSAGTVLIQSGGTVSCGGIAYLADNVGSLGILTVTGTGSQFNPYEIYVGASGAGTLTVQNGGTVSSSGGADIGFNPGSTGVANVTGAGALWTCPGIDMGFLGGTGQLTITAGGAVVLGFGMEIYTSASSITVNGGTLSTGGLVTAQAIMPNIYLSDPAGGSAMTVGTDNSSSIYAGSIADAAGGPGTVNKVGTGTLTLTGHLTNTGGYTASKGTIDFSGAVVQPGTGTLTAAAGATIQYDAGVRVFGGYLAGPGTHVVNGATFTGTTSYPSAAISVTGAASFVNFTNGGPFNVTAAVSSPTLLTRFTNQGSGSITVGAGSAINAADFETYGMLTLTPNTTSTPTILTNAGTSPLYFNGGSQTFIGTPATADPTGQSIVDYVDLHGNNAIVAGGLFVNNGGVFDTVGAGTSTIIAEFGALVKGAGFYQNTVKTQNGGKYQTGNSPGSAIFGNFVFGPGGVSNYIFAIDDATGTAGPSPGPSGLVSGWGLIKAVQASLSTGTTTGNFTWTATPSNPLTVAIDTLVNPTTVGTDVAGPMADFDPNQSYSWTAARWTGTYSGPTDAATLDADTSFDTSGFVNPIAGTFGWSLDSADQMLSLVYTPSSVPEPGTLALVGVFAAVSAAAAYRRRRRCFVGGDDRA